MYPDLTPEKLHFSGNYEPSGNSDPGKNSEPGKISAPSDPCVSETSDLGN